VSIKNYQVEKREKEIGGVSLILAVTSGFLLCVDIYFLDLPNCIIGANTAMRIKKYQRSADHRSKSTFDNPTSRIEDRLSSYSWNVESYSCTLVKKNVTRRKKFENRTLSREKAWRFFFFFAWPASVPRAPIYS
jgi:hypothetical protein